MKKSLTIGSIALLLVMLLALTGCEGPVGPAGTPGKDGDNGKQGNRGPSHLGLQDVVPIDLDVAYGLDDAVHLQYGVQTVYGTVPAGKTLYVTGETRVADGEELIIEGTLIIEKGAFFGASGRAGFGGFVKAGSGAKIEGDGIIVLPYPMDESFISGLAYTDDEVEVKTIVAGSLAELGTGDIKAVFGSAELLRIFESDSKPPSLNATYINDLAPAAIPVKKTLNLYGDNMIGGGPGTVAFTGTDAALVVKEGAVLTIPVGITVNATGGAIITNEEKGTIYLLTNTSEISDAGGGWITNDGTILVNAVVNPVGNLTSALDISRGDGNVKIAVPANDLNLYTVTLDDPTDLSQNIVVGERVTLASADTVRFFADARSGRTVTIEKGGILDFDIVATIPEAELVNYGIIKTGAVSPQVLKDIFAKAANEDAKFVVEASGNMAPTDDDGDFTIPLGISLSTSAPAANLAAAGHKLIVEGEFKPAAYTAAVDITVADSGLLDLGIETLTLDTGTTLTLPGIRNVTGDVLLPGGVPRGLIKTTPDESLPSVIKIDGVPYETDGAGVQVSQLRSILDVFDEDYESLRDKVDLAASAFDTTFKGIGAVQMLGPEATDISTQGDGANPYHELKINSRIAGIKAGFVPDSDIENLVLILVSTDDDSGHVQISDNGGYAGTVQKYVVIEYNQVRLLYNNLLSPLVEPFHIGVRTNRAQ
jgi:hypothetical protein